LLFREDGTYTCIIEAETLGGNDYNEINVNGMYSIKEIEETTIEHNNNPNHPCTLFKMLVSGSNDFDQLWVYHYIGFSPSLSVHFYLGNELFRRRGFTDSKD
jgi:hypothetical protein